MRFLSIQAQDFIEDEKFDGRLDELCRFLSIQAQDFIEDVCECAYGNVASNS